MKAIRKRTHTRTHMPKFIAITIARYAKPHVNLNTRKYVRHDSNDDDDDDNQLLLVRKITTEGKTLSPIPFKKQEWNFFFAATVCVCVRASSVFQPANTVTWRVDGWMCVRCSFKFYCFTAHRADNSVFRRYFVSFTRKYGVHACDATTETTLISHNSHRQRIKRIDSVVIFIVLCIKVNHNGPKRVERTNNLDASLTLPLPSSRGWC